MSEEIFEIYEFIKDNNIETHCYLYENRNREIVVLVSPIDAGEFLELLDENVPGSLDDGGYEAKITSSGYLGVDIMDIIDSHCHTEEGDKWFNRFKKYSSDNC